MRARLRAIVSGLFDWLTNEGEDQDFNQEIETHLRMLEERFLAEGLARDEARFAAKRAFGRVLRIKELRRKERPFAFLDVFLQEFRYARRTLTRSPAFSFVVILSLALGIAANTTIFTIINGTLLSQLIVDVDRVVSISTFPNERRDVADLVSVPEYDAWKKQNHSFEFIGARFAFRVRNVAGEGEFPPEQIETLQLNPAMFDVFGIKPTLGRLFSQAEDRVGDPATIVVISDRFWRSRFGADPNAIGKILRLDGVPTTIIGVVPAGAGEAVLHPKADLWIPWGLSPSMVESANRFNMVFARLREGVSIKQAQAEMDIIANRLAETFPERNRGRGIRIQSLQRARFGDLGILLVVLQGAVVLVLLIACSNVASLVIVRGSGRQTEVALRGAIGASRSRLILQGLTESLLLSFLGGTAGVLLAWVALRLFLKIAPSNVPGLDRIAATGIDLRILGFTAIITVMTALVFGLLPALKEAQSNFGSLVREASARYTDSRARQRFRLALVSGQTALSLVLLIGAGLMINTYIRLQGNKLGVDPTGLLSFRYGFAEREAIEFTGRRYMGVGLWKVNPRIGPTMEEIRERLQHVPGVASVAGLDVEPFRGALQTTLKVEGRHELPSPSASERPSVTYLAITPQYFETMRIPILRGRDFNSGDHEQARHVVIVNESMVRQFWPNQDPIGRNIILEYVPDDTPREVIGVVADSLITPFQQGPASTVYVPHLQQSALWQGPSWSLRAMMTFIVRVTGEPMNYAAAMRKAVYEVDPVRPLTGMEPVDQSIGTQLQPTRFYVTSLATFGATAALLAAIGIYGLVAHSVEQRRREIGIRIALGATRASVLRFVLHQTLLAIFVGVVLGLIGSALVTRLLHSALWGVSATDPWTFTVVSFALLFVALTAILIPTRRAMQVDPSVTLRAE